jgi:Putative adhesin
MDMPLPPPSAPVPPSPPLPSSLRRFFRTWRREIVRGGALFVVVVAVGLAVSRARVGFGVPWRAFRGFQGFDIDFDNDLFGAGRSIGDRWEWRGEVKPGQQLWVRNTNGPVEVLPGTGDQVEVISEKSWRHSDRSGVHMIAVPSARGVTICAVWEAREARCGDGGDYHMDGVQRNDLAVRFTIKLPSAVKVDVSTVNGDVAIGGAGAAVVANTVNGRVRLHTAAGPVKAASVNGSVEATLDALAGGDVELATVNGQVTAVLPRNLNAVLDATTLNGRVDTDFPLQVTGKVSSRHVRGTIGSGGPTLKLNTMNGSIAIRLAGDTPPSPSRPPRPLRRPVRPR